MSRPRRRWLRRVLLLLGLSTATLLGLHWLLQPERLGAALLAQVGASSGLDVAVTAPARLGYWPGLHLELEGLALTAPAADRALLRAERVDLYLPLSALWSPPQVRRLLLQAPQLDVDALFAWQTDKADSGPPAAPTLPAIDLLRIVDGRVVSAEWRAEAIQLELREFAAGSRLNLSLTLDLDAGGRRLPLALTLSGQLGSDKGEVAIDAAQLAVDAHSPATALQLAGRLHWLPPARLDIELTGSLQSLPPAWELPAQLDTLPGSRVELAYQGGIDLSATLHLVLVGDGHELRLATAPAALADWLRAGDWRVPAPLQLSLSKDRIDVDGLRIEGLRLQHGPVDDTD